MALRLKTKNITLLKSIKDLFSLNITIKYSDRNGELVNL